MKIMVVGASRGLGTALVEGLGDAGDTIIGVSRKRPIAPQLSSQVTVEWIEADFSKPMEATELVALNAPHELDVLIYNLGLSEEKAFTEEYSFLNDSDVAMAEMINVNVTAALMLFKRLIPRLLESNKPQIILTGSTSGLRQSGRPEVAFGTTKSALNGMADALRESFRKEKLAVTTLQLGYLNTNVPFSASRETAVEYGNGHFIPVHDVVAVVRTLLHLSQASFVRELVMPAIKDERF